MESASESTSDFDSVLTPKSATDSDIDPSRVLTAESISEPNMESNKPEPTISELMENVRAMIDHWRPIFRARRLARMMRIPEPSAYTTREAPQRVSAIEICPSLPKYMVVGTYSLVEKDEHEKINAGQLRKGMIHVLPVTKIFKPSYPGQLPPILDHQDFSCAVLDLHFHPDDPTLIGVAASNGQMYFFRLLAHADVIGRQLQVKLLPLGTVTIAENDERGLIPLITQFTWLPGVAISGKTDINDQQSVALLATTSTKKVVLVRCMVAAIKTPYDPRLGKEINIVVANLMLIQSHTFEAWTVATSGIKSEPGDLTTFFILSGGDDSALIGSLVRLGPADSRMSYDVEEPYQLFIDKKTHGSGVTSVLPFVAIRITDDPVNQPHAFKYVSAFLTGSYDETLRLFVFDPVKAKKTLITEVKLGGGGWRIKLMDEYIEEPSAAEIASNEAGPTVPSLHQSRRNRHFLVLVSCMHGGVKIVRVSYRPYYYTLPETTEGYGKLMEQKGWTMQILAKFRAGHSSMVYACDFRKDGIDHEPGSEHGTGAYTIVSTSFYDKKICVWEFVDELKKQLGGGSIGPVGTA